MCIKFSALNLVPELQTLSKIRLNIVIFAMQDPNIIFKYVLCISTLHVIPLLSYSLSPDVALNPLQSYFVMHDSLLSSLKLVLAVYV
jgi:hypothetical protein